jgi:hypothetical protein
MIGLSFEDIFGLEKKRQRERREKMMKEYEKIMKDITELK